MIFYPTLLLFFFYVKIARVHKKEEKPNTIVLLQHLLVLLSGFSLYFYGFTQLNWYSVVLSSIAFFIIAALIVTAIQLGIFIDGKPQFGISKLYKFFPALTFSIIALSAILWLQK
jgi:hypothetical protein